MNSRIKTTSETLEMLENRQMLSVDLSATISSPTAGANWTTGVEIRTLVTVANTGTERVRDVGLSVYASTDGTFDSSDVLLGSRNLSTMSAGESDVEDVEFTISSAVAAGTYTIFAVIDPSGVFAETDEGNNVSAGVSVTIAGGGGGGGGGGDDDDGDDNGGGGGGGGGDDDGDDDDNGGGGTGVSDAAVSITTASGTTMTLGREQRVLVNARNLGAFRIDPRVGVALYASADGVFDANADTLLGSRTVTLHDPGESEIEDIEFVLPASLGAGTFTLFAVIDRANEITETNEGNNVSEGVSVTFVTGGPGGGGGGGTGSDLTVSVTSPTAGGTMVLGRQQRVMVLASNLGTTDTGVRPVVSLYASADGTLDTAADVLLGARSLSFMSAGETELEDIEFVLPASLGAGGFTLFAVIDSSGIVTESDETNNTSAGVSVVFAAGAAAPSGSPDLTVSTRLEPGDDTLRTGTRETVFVTVSNSGSGNARKSSVRLYASSDDTLDPSEDRLLTTAQVAALRAGQSAAQAVSFVVPGSLSSGDYTVYAVVDDNSQNSESDESNNRSSGVSGAVDVGSFDLTGDLDQLRLADAIVQGTKVKGSAKLTYSNAGADSFVKGSKMSIQGFFRPADATDASQDVAVTREKLESLSSGTLSRGKNAAIAIEVPSTLGAGSYVLVFKIDSRGEIGETNEGNNEVIADGTFTIAAPFVDMTVTGGSTSFVSPGVADAAGRGSITMNNLGNVQGKGTVSIAFSLRNAEGTETAIGSPVLKRVELKPGRAITVNKLNLRLPSGLAAGEYTIVVSASVSSGFSDSVTTNNAFDIGALTIG